MQKRIYEILSNILKVPVSEDTSVSMQDTPEWSSLAHVDIIMSIEDEFDILFAEEDLASLTSQDQIVKKVLELASSK